MFEDAAAGAGGRFVEFCSGADFLVVARGGTLTKRAADAACGAACGAWSGGGGGITCVAARGAMVACGTSKRSVEVLSAADMLRCATIPLGADGAASVAWGGAPEHSHHLAVGTLRHEVLLYDMRSYREPVRRLAFPTAPSMPLHRLFWHGAALFAASARTIAAAAPFGALRHVERRPGRVNDLCGLRGGARPLLLACVKDPGRPPLGVVLDFRPPPAAPAFERRGPPMGGQVGAARLTRATCWREPRGAGGMWAAAPDQATNETCIWLHGAAEAAEGGGGGVSAAAAAAAAAVAPRQRLRRHGGQLNQVSSAARGDRRLLAEVADSGLRVHVRRGEA